MSLALVFMENVELQWRSCANTNSTTTNYDVGSTILVVGSTILADLKAIYLKSAMKVTILVQVSMLHLCIHFFLYLLIFIT